MLPVRGVLPLRRGRQCCFLLLPLTASSAPTRRPPPPPPRHLSPCWPSTPPTHAPRAACAAFARCLQIRESIKSLFPDRDCFTLVRPMNDEDALARLDSLDPTQLRPEFREGLARLTQLIFNRVGGSFWGGEGVFVCLFVCLLIDWFCVCMCVLGGEANVVHTCVGVDGWMLHVRLGWFGCRCRCVQA